MRSSLAYRALAGTANLVLPIVSVFSDKLAEGDRGRRGAVGRWREWAAAGRDRARPLLWCHASSVGEGLQAEEVLRHLRGRHPDWQIGYTFFSPSARALAGRQPADRADYLPYDTRPNVARLLALLAPRALIFTKLDLWPELATQARAAGVRTGMIAATVSPVSGRLRPAARALTRAGYAALESIGAVSLADAGRLESLGADRSRIRITGDPRFDSAGRIAAAVSSADPLLELGRGAPTLVAGSTWPVDEDRLLDAYLRVRTTIPEARLVLVPHEPTPAHLARIDRAAGSRGIEPVRLSAGRGPAPLVVVDRVGALATLYRAAAIAYVGGGFGSAGLHSVLEPAAAGVAVLFGPRWQSSREAGLLLEAGAARAVTGDPADLARIWSDWLADPDGLAGRGRAAAAVVNAGRGAAERSAELIEELMAGG